MAFSNTWNAAQPLDTQLANLLGQNIRDLKTDIHERMRAFGAGLIASRETPEAAFGTANFGVIFIAEDEGKIYRWNGSAWNEISLGSQKFADTSLVTRVNPTSGTVGNTVTIPANTLKVGHSVSIYCRWNKTLGAAGDKVNFATYFGSTFVNTADTNSAVPHTGLMVANIYIVGSTSQRSAGFGAPNGLIEGATFIADPTEDIATAIDVQSRVVNNTTDSTVEFDLLVVEIH